MKHSSFGTGSLPGLTWQSSLCYNNSQELDTRIKSGHDGARGLHGWVSTRPHTGLPAGVAIPVSSCQPSPTAMTQAMPLGVVFRMVQLPVTSDA
jgi:hypothetical protein